MSATYSKKFLAWLAKRKPSVRDRMLRLNAKVSDGDCLRGYHPHKRSTDYWRNRIGRREFVSRHGREAWAKLPQCCIIPDGHRKTVSRETELDCLWKLPDDHPMRQAKRENGQWIWRC